MNTLMLKRIFILVLVFFSFGFTTGTPLGGQVFRMIDTNDVSFSVVAETCYFSAPNTVTCEFEPETSDCQLSVVYSDILGLKGVNNDQ